jgi:hypothetical protein
MVAAVIETGARPGRDVGLQAVIGQQARDGLQFRTDERVEQAKPGLSDFFTARPSCRATRARLWRTLWIPAAKARNCWALAKLKKSG